MLKRENIYKCFVQDCSIEHGLNASENNNFSTSFGRGFFQGNFLNAYIVYTYIYIYIYIYLSFL